GHKHVIAGEALSPAGENPLQQGESVAVVDLVKSLGPPKALIPGLLEGDGLLVVDDRLVAVADDLALQGAVYGELNILRQQVERPAAVRPDQIPGRQETGSGDGAAGSQSGSGSV